MNAANLRPGDRVKVTTEAIVERVTIDGAVTVHAVSGEVVRRVIDVRVHLKNGTEVSPANCDIELIQPFVDVSDWNSLEDAVYDEPATVDGAR